MWMWMQVKKYIYLGEEMGLVTQIIPNIDWKRKICNKKI